MPLQTCMTLSIVENINRGSHAPNSLQIKKCTLRVPSPAKQEILNIYLERYDGTYQTSSYQVLLLGFI